MGEVVFRGPDAERAVQRLVTRDVSRLETSQAGYAAVCYEDGGTVDDVLVYKNPDDFLVVVNAANREKDVAHFREHTEDLDVEVADESDDWALLALQGPEAAGILGNFTDADLSGLKYYRYVVGEVDGFYAVISRTGYTARTASSSTSAPTRRPPVAPPRRGGRHAGRPRRPRHFTPGGRHVPLRQRARPRDDAARGGHRLRRPPGQSGRVRRQEALRREKEEGLRKKLVGFKVQGRGIARHDHPVAVGGETVGKVTSGTQSPTLGEAIGLALVSPGVEDRFEVEVRGKAVAARAVPLPFYKRDRK
jgi:aminomethyltransferase